MVSCTQGHTRGYVGEAQAAEGLFCGICVLDHLPPSSLQLLLVFFCEFWGHLKLVCG